MIFLRLPCAGKLGNCPKHLQRFHFTCLKCRWRWQHYKGWKQPPYYIGYTIPWLMEYYLMIHRETGRMFYQTKFKRVEIDPRGRLVMLRCSAVITILKIAGRFKTKLQISKLLVSFSEFFANITV